MREMYILQSYGQQFLFALYLSEEYVSVMKRDVPFLMRLNKLEKEGFDSAAEIAGIDLSSWARERLRMAATQELERAGRKAPFLKAIPILNYGS